MANVIRSELPTSFMLMSVSVYTPICVSVYLCICVSVKCTCSHRQMLDKQATGRASGPLAPKQLKHLSPLRGRQRNVETKRTDRHKNNANRFYCCFSYCCCSSLSIYVIISMASPCCCIRIGLFFLCFFLHLAKQAMRESQSLSLSKSLRSAYNSLYSCITVLWLCCASSDFTNMILVLVLAFRFVWTFGNLLLLLALG